MGSTCHKKVPNTAPGWPQDAVHEGQEGSIVYTLGLECIDPSRHPRWAHKMAPKWLDMAQDGLNMASGGREMNPRRSQDELNGVQGGLYIGPQMYGPPPGLQDLLCLWRGG